MKMELFHRIADPASAEVRRFITQNGLKDEIDFRNVDISESARQALLELTGRAEVPCLLAEGKAWLGKEAVIKYLLQMPRP